MILLHQAHELFLVLITTDSELIIKSSSDFKLLLTPHHETHSKRVSNRYFCFQNSKVDTWSIFFDQVSYFFHKKIDQVSLLVVFFDQVSYSTYSRIRRKGFRRKVVHRAEVAWDVLSRAAKIAWDVLSGVTKTALNVLSGVAY